ncbi:hypothetical protein V6N13_141968 [Hibiscus sabdariffa]
MGWHTLVPNSLTIEPQPAQQRPMPHRPKPGLAWQPKHKGLLTLGLQPMVQCPTLPLANLLGFSDHTTVTAAQGRTTADHATTMMILGRKTMSNYISCTHRLTQHQRRQQEGGTMVQKI